VGRIIREKLQAKITTTLTTVGNRVVSSVVQNQLEKARNNYYAKTQAIIEALEKKQREKGELTVEEQQQKERCEQKIKDFTEAWDVEQNSLQREAEIKEGGKIGIPELQVLANEDGTTIILEAADGEMKELVPRNGNASGKVVRLKETSPGHIVPQESAGFKNEMTNDNDCVLKAYHFAKNGTQPTAEQVQADRDKIVGLARRDPTLQLHNFIWRDAPHLLRCP
jgi:hypothetical protein